MIRYAAIRYINKSHVLENLIVDTKKKNVWGIAKLMELQKLSRENDRYPKAYHMIA